MLHVKRYISYFLSKFMHSDWVTENVDKLVDWCKTKFPLVYRESRQYVVCTPHTKDLRTHESINAKRLQKYLEIWNGSIPEFAIFAMDWLLKRFSHSPITLRSRHILELNGYAVKQLILTSYQNIAHL
ncbi:uncharacterized protein LOC114519519 [Dendronephthya gigantea]|uniref:uncharacterized protein LOC114519519 n=1 Tax=Dendronephthya gigantea TaxID=151771 RepID=UPI001068FBE0|nr:uncharacterized protein LOC114519519 [Dendronephthya gigantea]